MQFIDWSVQARTVYDPQLLFGPYNILAWTAQSVNLHITLKSMFYLFIIHTGSMVVFQAPQGRVCPLMRSGRRTCPAESSTRQHSQTSAPMTKSSLSRSCQGHRQEQTYYCHGQLAVQFTCNFNPLSCGVFIEALYQQHETQLHYLYS